MLVETRASNSELTPGSQRSRILALCALLGLSLWTSLVLSGHLAGWILNPIERLFLFGVLVLIPLALHVLDLSSLLRIHRTAFVSWEVLLFICTALVPVSFLLSTGNLAAMLVSGWAVLSFVLGWFGMRRILSRGLIRSYEVAIDIGVMCLPVAGCWLVASRAGATPLGFHEPIVLLTAVHFSFTGFLALTLIGIAGRTLSRTTRLLRSAYACIVFLIILSIPMVALGIAVSPLLEMVGVVLTAGSLLWYAGVALVALVPRLSGVAVRLFLTLSSLSLLGAMVLAIGYGVSEYVEYPHVDIPTMVEFHGPLNAYGFVLMGLLAWLMVGPISLNCGAIPFSRLKGRGRIGQDFFERIGAVAETGANPRGLVDDLSDYRRSNFAPDSVHADIRAFYECTNEYDMLVRPQWHPGFRVGLRLFKLIAKRSGQMDFPLPDEARENVIRSKILPIDSSLDGRVNVRAWVREFSRTKKALYAAAYSQHRNDDRTYMNIAFPFPGCNLTSILRLEPLSADGVSSGIILTTLSETDPGDEGVYLVFGSFPVRVPINETITVWAPEMPGFPFYGAACRREDVTVLARHDMWFLGFRFLTLDYFIFPRSDEGSIQI